MTSSFMWGFISGAIIVIVCMVPGFLLWDKTVRWTTAARIARNIQTYRDFNWAPVGTETSVMVRRALTEAAKIAKWHSNKESEQRALNGRPATPANKRRAVR